MAKDDKVNSPSSDHVFMESNNSLVRDLRAGTAAMRDNSKQYLPKDSAESPTNYKARVSRSFLFAAYDDTVCRLAARPFSEPVSLGDGAPPELMEWSKHVDGENRSLTDFARELFDEGVDRGVAGILVDYTNTSAAETRADQEGARPIWSLVSFEDVLGVRYEEVEGEIVLTQLRLKSVITKEDGRFGEVEFDQIRVYERVETEDGSKATVEIWERPHNTNVEFEAGPVFELSIGKIAFIPFYTNRVRPFVGTPPLNTLADKNLEHFQSSSDQRNILHFVRMPILFMWGIPKTEMGRKIAIGPNMAIRTNSENAGMKYVEHTGQAIDSGQKDIEHIEGQLEALGLEPLLRRRTGSITATEKALEQAEENSLLQSWVRSMEMTLERAIVCTLEWMGEPPVHVAVDVNDTFSMLQEADMRMLVEMKAGSMMTKKLLYQQLKSRGFFDEDFDVDAEVALLQDEVESDLSMLTPPDDDPPKTEPKDDE